MNCSKYLHNSSGYECNLSYKIFPLQCKHFIYIDVAGQESGTARAGETMFQTAVAKQCPNFHEE